MFDINPMRLGPTALDLMSALWYRALGAVNLANRPQFELVFVALSCKSPAAYIR